MENYNRMPVICIVGRPNVGKSSLFNCLFGEKRAVVVEQSGTTRDRVEAFVRISGVEVRLVDTGGYASGDTGDISGQVKDQISLAMEEAAIIVMVTDAAAGLVPSDDEVAHLLRKFSKPVIVVANKTDNDSMKSDAMEFYQLGFGQPEMISCTHRRGLRQLRRRLSTFIESVLSESSEEAASGEDDGALKIAVVGRPNVGKSSFINNLLDRNRVIVSDIPGTTRDSIDTPFEYEGDRYVLIDTAGIRHKRKIKTVVDTFSMMRSKQAIERADVVVLLLDSADGATRDDIDIIELIENKGKACLILVNKWDLAKLAEDMSMEEYEKSLLYASEKLTKFPIAFISAKTGRNVVDTLAKIKLLNSNLDIQVSTAFLNRIFDEKDPALISIPRRKKRPNFLYAVQSGARPVVFKFFVNDPGNVLPIHYRFIENQLRQHLPLKGIPIRILTKRSRKDRKA
ncbi:MAG: ribosome biogenesis GTPase Der [Candidatus Tantalella remota]|nr:ribosome biogenesis GTPase Der [Candidatus Tantalella remota]